MKYNINNIMKVIYNIKASLLALAAMVACTEMEIRDESQDYPNNGLLQELSITGKDFQFEDATRSSVTIGESGASFAWDEDDVIGIFPDKGDQVSFAMDEGAGTQTATFSGGGWALKSSAKYAAYYPHVYENRDMTAIPVSYVGQTQNGNGNTDHIGAYDFMAAGVSTPENGAVAFDMQHLGTLVQLTITVPEPSTLTKVVLTSSTEFTETGTIDLTAETPSITADAQSNTFEITLNNIATTEANEDVTVYFMTAPVDLTDSDLTITIHFADATSREVELIGKDLQAGKAYKLSAELKETIPNNQIWYTSSDGNVVNPTYENTFGANIKSNVYENGKGIITFDSEVTSVGEYSFEYNSTLTNIVIPKSVTTIGEGAFFCCSSLLELTIPSSVTEIGAKILYKCDALTSIVVDKENTIYDSRNNCNAIIETETNTLICGCSNSVIPDNVTKIHDYAFARKHDLISIIIPSSVTTIGEEAFYECTSLTNIEFSNGLITIGTNAFRDCPITIIDIPNSVIHIGDYAFGNCPLTNVTLPNNLQIIGQHAFLGCAELTTVKVKATTPPSMSNNAFQWGNSNLVIHVPAGSLERYKAADYWKDLNIIEDPIPNNQIWYTSSDDNVVNYTGKHVSNIYSNGRGVITFDNEITAIGNYFNASTTLTSVTLPNSVTSISSYAFKDCTSLQKINIHNNVRDIGNEAFRNTAITKIELPIGLTFLGDAFNNCKTLQEVTLPDDLIEIPSELFYGCSSLSKVNIPNQVTTIGQSAFYGCSSLSTITIPNSVTTIKSFAFAATGIINFTFPNKIKTIVSYSVYNCPKLESITIPSTVTSIEYAAFFANDALKTVRIYATKPPTITNGSAIFNGDVRTTCVLEVPKSYTTTYYNATGWAFSYITEIQ